MGAKGKPKDPGSGRKKGTLNKNSLDLHLKCEQAGVDVFEELLKFVTTPFTDANMRLTAIKELCKYLYPTRKAIEVSGQLEALVVNVYDYTDKKK